MIPNHDSIQHNHKKITENRNENRNRMKIIEKLGKIYAYISIALDFHPIISEMMTLFRLQPFLRRRNKSVICNYFISRLSCRSSHRLIPNCIEHRSYLGLLIKGCKAMS